MKTLKNEIRAEAHAFLYKFWNEEDAAKVIELAGAAAAERPYEGDTKKFISEECAACGGNWGAMLLTGIRAHWPDVYAAIPEHMGDDGMTAFACLCYVLRLCGVVDDDCTE